MFLHFCKIQARKSDTSFVIHTCGNLRMYFLSNIYLTKCLNNAVHCIEDNLNHFHSIFPNAGCSFKLKGSTGVYFEITQNYSNNSYKFLLFHHIDRNIIFLRFYLYILNLPNKSYLDTQYTKSYLMLKSSIYNCQL